MKLSHRPTYTPDQMYRYFDHIALPDAEKRLDGHVSQSQHGYSFLATLQKYHMAAVPFENLSLHYSPHHSVSLDPQDLYRKIVERHMGGRCMENNAFFAAVLRSLGYVLYSAGARVSKSASLETRDESEGAEDSQYSGWSHMVNIVSIDGRRYMVDVGFGSNASIQPLPLVDGKVLENVSPQSVRLLHANIPQNTDSDQKLWRFQYRFDDSSSWTDGYCFTELEFLPEDFVVMSYSTSTSRTSWFTQKIVCVKTLLEKNETIGTLILFEAELKQRIRGKTELVATLESEEQRIAALEKHFHIKLNENECKGIRGTVTELRDGSSKA
ncbi:MAG: N-terminal acetyltransferase [Sclerophora amabilis]|nr:MAG: N-terminal acetyltransferase [Sclerophora amabilis]